MISAIGCFVRGFIEKSQYSVWHVKDIRSVVGSLCFTLRIFSRM